MTDTQNEVFKSPVNKIRLFEHGAPGSQNLKLTRKYYTCLLYTSDAADEL